MPEYIFGRNAVLEALNMGLPVKKVFLSPTIKDYAKLSAKIQQSAPYVKIEQLSRRKMDSIAGGIRTGGVSAILQDVKRLTSIDSLVSTVTKQAELPLLIALDEIHDPRNFGAIIRSAAGAGFHGIVYQKRRQVGITGVVAATSAGACFKIPLCEVVNLPRALNTLKNCGFWIYGTDTGNCISLYNIHFNTPLVIVVGSEKKGMRRLVRTVCDEIIAIPLQSGLESLNVSVAAGITMFEIMRQINR